MTIGGSIALIIIGAILRFAVTWTPNGIDLQIVGDILMVGGVVGLIISLSFLIARRRRSTSTQVYEERRYTEPPGGGYRRVGRRRVGRRRVHPASGPLPRLVGVRDRARGHAGPDMTGFDGMGIVSPGFSGRRRDANEKLPPGQYLVTDFPVLSAGPTPRVDTGRWEFAITTETGTGPPLGLGRLPGAAHRGADGRPALRDQMVQARHPLAGGVPGHAAGRRRDQRRVRLAHSYGGYTTNLPLEDLLDGQAWVAFEYGGEPLAAEHGGPARLLVPHLYFWKSAKWVQGIDPVRP